MSYARTNKIIKRLFLSITLLIIFGVIFTLAFNFIRSKSWISSIFSLITQDIFNTENNIISISGVTESGIKYNINSQSVENYLESLILEEDLLINAPAVSLELSNEEVVTLNSETAVLNQKTNKIFFKDNVIIQSESYEINTSEAYIDIDKQLFISQEYTTAKYMDIRIESQGLEVDIEGSYFELYGPYSITGGDDEQ